MKLIAALTVLFLVDPSSLNGAQAASAVSGGTDDNAEQQPTVRGRGLQEVLDDNAGGGLSTFQMLLEMDSLPIETREENTSTEGQVNAEGFLGSYKSGSCTCAKDAYMAVYKEAQVHLKMIPLVPAVVASEDSMFEKMQREIDRLLNFAVCFLHSIDCGCDDSRKGFMVVKNKYKVSTYQCCCDVNAARDIIIDAIKELSQWETTMAQVTIGGSMATVVNTGLVHKRQEFHVLEGIVQRAYKAVMEIGGIYAEPEFDIPSYFTSTGEFTTHGSCQGTICADDTMYIPELEFFQFNDPKFNCGATYGADAACAGTYIPGKRFCDVDSKTVCAVAVAYSGCSDNSDCGPWESCFPFVGCVYTVPLTGVVPPGTPCP